jgi:hypothetical protein
LHLFANCPDHASGNSAPGCEQTRPGRIPFRVLFKGYEGDPVTPDKVTFELMTLDLKQPKSSFKLGDLIPNTKWKLQSFKYVINRGPTIDDEDVSELTVIDTETQEQKVLTLSRVTDFPTFHYENGPAK